MKRPSVYIRQHATLDTTMTPMIDVVFLLLVFFLWTASFQVVEYVLPTRLSEAPVAGALDTDEPRPELDFDPVVIQLLWQDERPLWIVNEAPASSLEELARMLTTVAGIKPDVPVIIDPDEAVPFGHVIDVYDASLLAGCQKIQFAALEEI